VAALIAVSVVELVGALRPTDQARSEVTVARRDLVAGHVVGAGDVTLRGLPSSVLPDGALRYLSEAVGATLTSDVRRGEVLTDARVAVGFSSGLAPGEVATPVRLADGGVAAVLSVGASVDLVATDRDGTPQPVVSGARVIAIPDQGGSMDPLSGVLIVLAVPAESADDVVATGADRALSVVLH
jgi:pilus assembly protein CpaB